MKRIGNIVEFLPRVYKAPYTPYFDAYKGHKFKIIGVFNEDPSHVMLECVTGDVKVNGMVHDTDLRIVG